jgi:CheY-like chemotaxis protein
LTQLLFISPETTNLKEVAAESEVCGGRIRWATSGHQALAMLARHQVDLVVVDETVGDMTGLDFVKRLVSVNPMINCAVVSSLSEEDFHEASEGLGILMPLPPRPGRADGQRLMTHLKRILGLTAGD